MFDGALNARRFCVFFFQAEDGIRDGTVTGVQTCALPILVAVVAIGALAYLDERRRSEDALEDFGEEQASTAGAARLAVSQQLAAGDDPASPRSEERRVGKESSCPLSP